MTLDPKELHDRIRAEADAAEADETDAEPATPAEPDTDAGAEPGAEPDEDADSEPDEDAEHEPEPEREPQPETPPMTEKEIEAMHKKLDTEAARHNKRVQEILGANIEDFEPCPLCYTPGFALAYQGQEIAPEQIAAVQALLGVEDPTGYPDDPNVRACSICDAGGMVRTGSKVPQHALRPCPRCQGTGFEQKEFTPPPPPTVPAAEGNGYQPPQPGAWQPPPPPVTANLS